jgi:hypothetical protein
MVRRPVVRPEGDRGAVIVLFALCLTVMMMMSAFVIDLGNARQVASQSQAGVDAAALAAAQSTPAAFISATDPVFALAAEYAAESLFDGTIPEPVPTGCDLASRTCTFTIGAGSEQVRLTVTHPYAMTGAGRPTADKLVFVEGCRTEEAMFGRVVGNTGFEVCRSAVARRVRGTVISDAGVLALEHGVGCVGYDLRGSVASKLTVSPGSVIANCEGNPPNSYAGSGAAIDASLFYSVGTCEPPSRCVGNSTTPTEQLELPVPDPLADLPEPSSSEAGFTHLTVADYNALPCLDGLYRVRGTGGVDVLPTCPGETAFTYLADAGVRTNLKTVIRQHAPAIGPYEGVSLFLGRSNDSVVQWNGNSHSEAHYRGTVYAPAGSIDWGGNIDVFITGQVIAQSFLLHGGGGPKNAGFVVNLPENPLEIELIPDIGLEH